MMKYFAIGMIVLLASCSGNEDKKAEEVDKKDTPLTQSKNSSAFNSRFEHFLTVYFHLKDRLVLTNDTLAITSAKELKAAADSLQLTDLKADQSIVEMAKGYIESISAEAAALSAQKNIEEMRKSFQVISDNMYDLVRTVRYDQQVLYHQYCPMAFNDQGAYWLSSSTDVKNPYFGKKMLTCGEVKDSIDFRGK